MAYYQSMINELTDVILRHELYHDNTIIIGNNSSGKSELLKSIISKSGFAQWYLIDSVNRYFSVSQVFKMSGEASRIQYSERIAEHRIMADNYNLKDTFYYMGVPTPIENLYFEFEGETKKRMRQFLGVEVDIRQSEVGYKVYLDNVESSLSSGYQALMRIFVEMEYLCRTMKSGAVIIDEIDEFLFSYNSGRIFQYLRQVYSSFSFVVTTHSADLIASARAANIILLAENSYELFDAEDFNSISQVYNIFDSVFLQTNSADEKEKVESCLRRLLNNKVAGIWKEADQNELERMKNTNLTKVQKVLIRQIEEW
ncbi:MAG: ATP-binding protein [Lachnospiraceae bacterium]|nr:ATP-binding protein [Lachnospiraceae bacterium]